MTGFEGGGGGGEQFGWGVAVSAALHLLVAAAVLFWPAMDHRRQIYAPAYQVRLVGSPALPPGPAPAPAAKAQAEPKAAPKPEPKAPPKIQPKAEPKPKPEPKEAIGKEEKIKKVARKKEASPKDTPSPTKVLEERLKKMQAKVAEEDRLDNALARVERRAATQRANNAALAGASGAYAPGGGGGSPGGELSLKYQVYYNELWERIRRNWIVPEALMSQARGREVVVVMRLGRAGELEKVWLENSSGVERLDASALRAVERSAPFPALPSGLAAAGSLEVGLRFRPEDAQS